MVAALATACGGTAQSDGDAGKPAKGGTLRVALAAQPSSFNPVLGNSGSADFIVQYSIFDTLTEFNSETGEVDPRLAESWTFSDPTTFVMTLRAGAAFHDGSPVDAEAVVWFLNHARGPEGGGAQVDLAKVESAEATGELEVTVQLTEPFTGLPWVLSGRSGMVMSRAAYEKDPEGFAQHPVGAGPYRFVSYKKGAKIELERFEDYWNPDGIYPDAVEFTIFQEPTTILNAIKSGEQNLSFSVSPKDVAQLESDPSVNVTTGSSYLLDQIHMNRSKKPLNDPRVRRALSLALDRDVFVKAATFGLGEPGYQFFPEDSPAAAPSIAVDNAPDLDQARSLMAEAGYGDGVGLTMLTQTSEIEVRKAEVLQAQLAEIGVELDIRPTELTQAVAEMFQDQSADLFFAYGVSRADVGDTINATFGAEALYNLPHEEHPAVMEKLAEANATSDIAERNKHLQAAAEAIADESLLLPVAFNPFIAVTTSSVHGVRVDAVLKPRLDGIWIEN
ncbi:ABC transporter substrate-binding protein [Nocardioides sp. LHD-245]|uniref:ABC transporter substrate-binding protein n=1 Tax=Nocardioides sp. LHD-245 TaxID=3051387 RepID=UPI0027E1040C|nr:ABC transporter substrate-binding protein [Nocardioides sp. LHD-245]